MNVYFFVSFRALRWPAGVLFDSPTQVATWWGTIGLAPGVRLGVGLLGSLGFVAEYAGPRLRILWDGGDGRGGS